MIITGAMLARWISYTAEQKPYMRNYRKLKLEWIAMQVTSDWYPGTSNLISRSVAYLSLIMVPAGGLRRRSGVLLNKLY
ncbi:hypothetical protein FOMG_19195 [Fusarium oxysporum f. sp. melonis 26406]|uniref:Uncharacterized protein n=1 Tax=Fusarium oxysporum f. sp. melonis 26406 TaxID=1089452 RepID=W9Z743_FUSOX|nr:hypothetical protein FOMG_19195 [Fusarium oxysporum f. sp. melonis 26406]